MASTVYRDLPPRVIHYILDWKEQNIEHFFQLYGDVKLSQLTPNQLKELFELGEIQSDGRLPIPVHFLADDFATGCPVPLFDQYISIFREKGILK